MNTLTIALPLVLVCSTPGALAQCGITDKEPFTNGSNQAGWTWGNAGDTILAAGGNPHAYLRNDNLDTFAPQPRTALGVSSIFTGDYASGGVTALGIDLRTFALNFNTCQRPLSLILENDNGTPTNVSDDRFVYFVSGEQVPCVDGQWHSYTIGVPSQSAGIPPGWQADPNSPLTPDQTWQLVIRAVTRVRWFYGDPTNFFIFATWSVGMDNPRITHGPGQLTYCVSKTNSLGCSPAIESTGMPSAFLPVTFDITCAQVRNQKPGLLFYSLSGRAATPFSGGTLCMATPIKRTPAQGSGGTPLPAADCTGAFAIDFNAYIQSGVDPSLQVTGTVVNVQWWGRDAQPTGTMLSNALEFVVCP